MTAARPRVVAFDLMDTVIHDPYREALQAATGLAPAELFARRDASAYPAFERGELTEEAYWAVYRDAGIDIDVDTFHATRRAGYRWIAGMRALVADLAGQTRRVVASNYPHWVDEVAETVLAGVFDDVHASCHLGARKPEAAFFARLLEVVGAGPDEVLFVDDRDTNVAGARDAGLRAHRFVDAPTLRGWLRGHGLAV